MHANINYINDEHYLRHLEEAEELEYKVFRDVMKLTTIGQKREGSRP